MRLTPGRGCRREAAAPPDVGAWSSTASGTRNASAGRRRRRGDPAYRASFRRKRRADLSVVGRSVETVDSTTRVVRRDTPHDANPWRSRWLRTSHEMRCVTVVAARGGRQRVRAAL